MYIYIYIHLGSDIFGYFVDITFGNILRLDTYWLHLTLTDKYGLSIVCDEYCIVYIYCDIFCLVYLNLWSKYVVGYLLVLSKFVWIYGSYYWTLDDICCHPWHILIYRGHIYRRSSSLAKNRSINLFTDDTEIYGTDSLDKTIAKTNIWLLDLLGKVIKYVSITLWEFLANKRCQKKIAIENFEIILWPILRKWRLNPFSEMSRVTRVFIVIGTSRCRFIPDHIFAGSFLQSIWKSSK